MRLSLEKTETGRIPKIGFPAPRPGRGGRGSAVCVSSVVHRSAVGGRSVCIMYAGGRRERLCVVAALPARGGEKSSTSQSPRSEGIYSIGIIGPGAPAAVACGAAPRLCGSRCQLSRQPAAAACSCSGAGERCGVCSQSHQHHVSFERSQKYQYANVDLGATVGVTQPMAREHSYIGTT